MEEGIRAQTAEPKDKYVLVVDHDRVQRDMMEKMLGEQGFQTASADSADEALESVARRAPDLILLEYMLPGKGGFEMLRELQESEAARTPVVVSTAKAVDDSTINHIKNEPNVREFFKKPVQLSVLINLLHKLLNTRPMPKKPEDTGGFGKTGFGKTGW